MNRREAGGPLLTLRGVSKIYRMGEVDVPALRDVDLDVYQGEFLIVLGTSGSGKTTLLNLIGGMDRPTTGSVRFGETDLARASDRELTRYRRTRVGFVFQFYNLVPTLTAVENVQVAVEVSRDPMDPYEALRVVGLEERADHFPSQLSGGEQQRVAIARAMAGNPMLMLCDEPTGNLDSDTGGQVLDLLARLNHEGGRTVVVITHDRSAASRGDRVVQLRDGRVESVSAP